MQIYNTSNLKQILINKGIHFDKTDEVLFNKSDYYQVINAHKMLFITRVETIDDILKNIDNKKEITRYQKSFGIKTIDNNFKENVIDSLSKKYGIKSLNMNDKINELKKVEYIYHIYDSRCSFNDFYRMYEFEHDFRVTLMNYVLRIENSLKQIFIKTLNDFGGIKDNFLTNIENYDTSTQNYSNSIRTLKEILNIYDLSKSKAITKKIEQNISVPYYILINEMTFGNVVKCIKYLKPMYSEKIYQNLIERFTKINKNAYSKLNSFDMFIFESMLESIGAFRNVLAHNQPIYNCNIKDNAYTDVNDLEYFIPYVLKNDVMSEMKRSKVDMDHATKICQLRLTNEVKKIFQTFFGKDSFNQNLDSSPVNLSYVVYLIYKINKNLDNKCTLKDELFNLFYKYNILYKNNKYLVPSDKSTLIPRKYLKHFKFDDYYTKYSGISLKFINEL